MSVINKDIDAVFGHALLGRAVSALDFNSQNIPSELYDGFRAVCGLARPFGTTQRRYPWRIIQPGTPQQVDVWDKFLYCTRCFGDQSPAMRQWWYEQSIPSGLFYYTYFMSQTLPIVHQGLIPDWCLELFSEYFPGTKLDLVKWLEPIVSVDPTLDATINWWVNEKLYIRSEYISGSGNTHFSLEPRFFRLPLSFSCEAKLSTATEYPSPISTAVLLGTPGKQVRMHYYRGGLSFGYFTSPGVYQQVHVESVGNSLEEEHKVGLVYRGDTYDGEFYFDGALVGTFNHNIEPVGQPPRFAGYWGLASSYFPLVIATYDDIIIRRVE